MSAKVVVPPFSISTEESRVPPVDEIGGHEGRFGREDVVVQPGHQREIVGKAAQQGHGGVAVRVDEAGG